MMQIDTNSSGDSCNSALHSQNPSGTSTDRIWNWTKNLEAGIIKENSALETATRQAEDIERYILINNQGRFNQPTLPLNINGIEVNNIEWTTICAIQLYNGASAVTWKNARRADGSVYQTRFCFNPTIGSDGVVSWAFDINQFNYVHSVLSLYETLGYQL